jgi:hypothetical protein
MTIRTLLARAGIGAMVLAAAVAPVAAAAKDPYIGHWTATDSADQSSEMLAIGGGPAGTYHVMYHDMGASVCGVDGSGTPLYGAIAQGVLELSGGSLSGDLEVYCLDAAHSPAGLYTFSFTDNGNGTLTDGSGDIWSH